MDQNQTILIIIVILCLLCSSSIAAGVVLWRMGYLSKI